MILSFFTSLPKLMHAALALMSKSQLHGVTGPRPDDVISLCSLRGTKHSKSKAKCRNVAAGALKGYRNLIHLRDFFIPEASL